MIKGIILDFDQTIADTSMLKIYRDSRQWNIVKENIHRIILIEGFNLLYEYISRMRLKTCIVSRAPYSRYIKHALKQLNLEFDYVIGYEEGGHQKPSPFPMMKALNYMGLKNNEVISIGDEISDSQAAKSAGIINIVLKNNNPYADFCVNGFQECIKIINLIGG
jgi:phosphoglycolate phosphatase-like HAD superfamily hydrolase